MSASREDADVETSSEAYARRFSGAVGTFFLETQARATLELLAPFSRASVLDVGGGHAQLTGPLVEAGHPVTIFGSDPRCSERVQPWLDAGRARFEAGDLLALPFPDRAYDVVLCYRLLPHVGRWRDLVGELCRVARRAVIVDYPSARSANAMAGGLFGAKKGVEGDTRPFSVFRDADLEGAFARHRFRPTGRRPQFFIPMALHRALRLAPLSRASEALARGLRLVRAFGSPVILRLEPSDA
jgi:2-polyprenyl-3-methyl-5-hydroxy-6-metoxy-1,4-benzoquinol methylase